MPILLLRTRRGIKYAEKIADAVGKKGISCFIAHLSELPELRAKHHLTPENTLIHSRTAGPYTNHHIEALEQEGFRVINPSRTLKLTSNKFMAHEHALSHGIPVAETIKVRKGEVARSAVRSEATPHAKALRGSETKDTAGRKMLHFSSGGERFPIEDIAAVQAFLEKHHEVVLKPIYSQGQGVFCKRLSWEDIVIDTANIPSGSFCHSDPLLSFRAKSRSDGTESRNPFSLSRAGESLFYADTRDSSVRPNTASLGMTKILNQIPGAEFQVQAFIPYRRLIRVIVIDFKALPEATVWDEPLPGSWKCSVCLNPFIKKLEKPAPELLALAEKTARAFDARINFIDFFEVQDNSSASGSRFILNEINTACNLMQHELVTGVPIHEKIAEFLIAISKTWLRILPHCSEVYASRHSLLPRAKTAFHVGRKTARGRST